MLKKLLFVVIILLFISSVYAQVQWPAVSQTTMPWTRWWWEGSAVNEKDLTSNLEKYKAAGLGGVEITPIYGVAGYEDQFIDYLSPKWVQMLQHTLSEGKRLGLGIDMATGTGWPFGGGPLIGAEEACRDFVFKTYNLKEGEQLKDTVQYIQQPMVRSVGNQIYELLGIYRTEETKGTISEPLLKEASKTPDISQLVEPVFANKNLQALALDQVKFKKALPLQTLMAYSDKGKIIDLTDKVDASGKLNWVAPGGNWELYAIFMGWHGKMVERAAPGDEGNVIDHFSAKHLKTYLGWFDKSLKGADLSGLRGFFNDSYEVDDARGQSNWTSDFFDEFKKRRGYESRDHLPELLKEERDEQSIRVLYDYRQTVADMLLDNFTKPWHDWAKEKGKIVRNQSHGSPANILDLYAVVDIPETEGTELLRFKFASSAGNVTGKKLVSAEAATWLNEHFKSSWSDVKKSVDNYFLGGVNHIVYHGTAYSPEGDPWPGWLFYAAVHFQPVNPMWKDFGAFNSYVTRCQSFLQTGTPDNDVLLYFPFADKNSSPARELLHHYDGMNGFEKTTFYSAAEDMQNKGYAFDLIWDKQLQQIEILDRKMLTGGNSYQVILLAETKLVPLETMKKLVASAKEGATVIFYKGIPASVPGFAHFKERKKEFENLLKLVSFKTAGNSDVQKATMGKGLFILGDNLENLLSYAKVRRETLAGDGLQFLRRKHATGNNYFIVNSSEKKIDKWVALHGNPVSVVLFDPMKEISGLAEFRKNGGGATEIYLQLEPGESSIIQTSSRNIKGTPFPYYKNSGNKTEITGEWSIEFISGGPELPASQTLHKLVSWTDLPGDEGKKFSGTAKYSIHFAKPFDAPFYKIDLGDVKYTAEVLLNAKKIATLIGPQYAVTIPASLVKPENDLTIVVANGMANRITDMDKRDITWKKFYNVNFPARLSKNRGPNGLFAATKWEPEPSGLLGPVTITGLSNE